MSEVEHTVGSFLIDAERRRVWEGIKAAQILNFTQARKTYEILYNVEVVPFQEILNGIFIGFDGYEYES